MLILSLAPQKLMAEINDARVETAKDHEGDIESLNYCLIFGVKADGDYN